MERAQPAASTPACVMPNARKSGNTMVRGRAGRGAGRGGSVMRLQPDLQMSEA